MDLMDQISQYLQEGEEEKVFELVQQAIKQGNTAKDILNEGLIAGMNVVGQRFKAHEIFLPDVLMAAKAMVAGMEELKPLLIKTGIPSRGKVVLGTVQGDLHDIGKNLVGVMLKGAGFEVIDLGNDVPPEEFLRVAHEQQATVIGMSALLTTTMPIMKSVVDLIKEKNLYGKIKTIIGGAPVTKEYAQEIGADKYSYDASHAVESIKELLGVN